jgi:hypothetical protein
MGPSGASTGGVVGEGGVAEAGVMGPSGASTDRASERSDGQEKCLSSWANSSPGPEGTV